MQTIHTNGTQGNTLNAAESGVRGGTPGAGLPAPAPHDRLTRLRDKWGNRLG